MFLNAFEGRKVMVTGHTGFKGSRLACWLIHLGAEVAGYSLPAPTTPSNFEACALESRMDSVIGDVRDPENFQNAMARCKPEFVFHMAAQPLVRLSYTEPVETYQTNVMGVIHLLESVRSTPSVRTVINITSDKCYENREWAWGYRETDPMGGHDPYSSSKGCSELVTAAYRNSFFPPGSFLEHGVSISTVRAGNVIGGGDWAQDRLIPDCIRSLAEGKPIRIRNPESVRPWQHVLEPLSGYLWLAALMDRDGPTYGDSYNFGPELADTLTVGEIAERMVSRWSPRGTWEKVPKEGKEDSHEATFLRLDCSRAYHRLRWVPVMNIDTAVEWTVNWYHRYYSGSQGMFDTNVEEIESYFQTAREMGREWALQ